MSEATESRIVFIDLEVGGKDNRIKEYGGAKSRDHLLHTASAASFSAFISGAEYICGHNIIDFDLRFCKGIVDHSAPKAKAIDTLHLSPLLFPQKPYHRLVKDDKLENDQLNNPASDAVKAMELFYDEVNAYQQLPSPMKIIYHHLLHEDVHFSGFFQYVGQPPRSFFGAESIIRRNFSEQICANANIHKLIAENPVELAYALAIISVSTDDRASVTPPWVFRNYPKVANVIRLLRETPCKSGCPYCGEKLDVRKSLKRMFGFDQFRTYNGEPLQEKAADAAVNGHSLLAIFPTGGGKSITFQLPALMAGEASRGLTVIISPLQSLMKDQVDNLSDRGITEAVTINGLLSPVERAEAIERVYSGKASLLYLSPESLRSRTIEKLLLSRNVVRFVIDEAHCFSAWGQDFRVDYLYIGPFIARYVKQKQLDAMIPISCFTATAKPKVVSDIQDYFRQKLGLELELYTTNAARTNLHYAVLHMENEEQKYLALRRLIEQKQCPTIVYVSRTKKTVELADRLTKDGFPARPFNGKMDRTEKIANQEAFIANQVQVIVATSAFGMGVDKKDVQLVVHYEISDSLENYVQEAGRAGRDQSLQADCYVLFNEDDLDKHFLLLTQTKLSIAEIQQIWKAIKDLTKTRPNLCRSALEIARQAGWDDNVTDIETRVKTAIAALENAGYVERGKNIPRVFATGILPSNMEEAAQMIDGSARFSDQEKVHAKRIIKSLISSRSIAKAGNDEAESRIDYLADTLGLETETVMDYVQKMCEEGLLADSQDMSAFIKKTDQENRSLQILARFSELESYLSSVLAGEMQNLNYKEINNKALEKGIKGATVRNIKSILYYWTIRGYIRKSIGDNDEQVTVFPSLTKQTIETRIGSRREIAEFIVEYLFEKSRDLQANSKDEVLVPFSLMELLDNYKGRLALVQDYSLCTSKDIQDALLYLSKIGAMTLEGGFLVLYNGLSINRLVMDNKIRYKQEDYKQLNEFYRNRMQQIHIVGEYANMMVRDYDEAVAFVQDYFEMEYRLFIAKYFKGNRSGEINRNITPEKYEKLFGSLSPLQAGIIQDDQSKYIAVIAGPGSGKTRVLVHKLASLLLMEDVKSEQLLMLTFSRAAATEFKRRLIGLIGSAAHYVEIKTFHSYCFDLLGKVGNLTEADEVVPKAAEMIANGEVEIGRITKTVLVIDEAQDMDSNEFQLVQALMARNEDMRVIAVGDDDQNIYEFRGSDSAHMRSLITDYQAKQYEMVDNYRSDQAIVTFANAFVQTIPKRMKKQQIRSVTGKTGSVSLIRHTGGNPETAIVEYIRQHPSTQSTCVLTSTNEEAFRIMGLLAENDIRAKLIQTNDGFNLYNLAEIRSFIRELEKDQTTPIISDQAWDSAILKIQSMYEDSKCLRVVFKLIGTFAEVNKVKYRSDFTEFVSESKWEDFIGTDSSTILVSTIHKSKGREFDRVFVLLSDRVNYYDVKAKRALYVGFTRAKNELQIHYSGDFINRFRLSATSFQMDDTPYPDPERIMMELTHRDVNLGFFRNKKRDILRLKSGSDLLFRNDFFFASTDGRQKPVAQLSKSAKEFIHSLIDQEYEVESAEVRFIVAWKGDEDKEESAIILPNLRIKKKADDL